MSWTTWTDCLRVWTQVPSVAFAAFSSVVAERHSWNMGWLLGSVMYSHVSSCGEILFISVQESGWEGVGESKLHEM